MKVYAKKIYYEQDLYHYPDENISYGLFPLGEDITNAAPKRRDLERVYSKGSFKEWKFEVQKHCCGPMEEAIGAERIIFEGLGSNIVDVSIACACWPIQSMRINFCPFCRKKIIIEEKG